MNVKTSTDAITHAEPKHRYGKKCLNKTEYTRSTTIQPMQSLTKLEFPHINSDTNQIKL